MSNKDSSSLNSLSDVAAILLASVSGDKEAAQTVVQQIALGDDARVELATALRWLVFAATEAIQKDLEAAIERGDDRSAAIEYLVAVSRHAHRHGG